MTLHGQKERQSMKQMRLWQILKIGYLNIYGRMFNKSAKQGKCDSDSKISLGMVVAMHIANTEHYRKLDKRL